MQKIGSTEHLRKLKVSQNFKSSKWKKITNNFSGSIKFIRNKCKWIFGQLGTLVKVHERARLKKWQDENDEDNDD